MANCTRFHFVADNGKPGGVVLSVMEGPATDSRILSHARMLTCRDYHGKICVERGQLYTAVIFHAEGERVRSVLHVRPCDQHDAHGCSFSVSS